MSSLLTTGLRALVLWLGLLALAPCVLLHGADQPPVPAEIRAEFRYLVQMLNYLHPRRAEVDKENLPQIIDLFLARLDPDHACFTRKDVEQLNAKYRPNLATQITYTADFTSAFAAYDLFKERMDARTAWISDRLKQWHDFARTDLAPPASPAAWLPANELDRYWEQRLRGEWALEVARGATEAGAADRVRRHHEAAAGNTARSGGEIAVLFANSLAALYDPDTAYLSAAELDDFAVPPAGPVAGIAASLSRVGSSCVFQSVTPGGPADFAGIVPGDRLLAVEPAGGPRVDVAGLDLRQVTDLLRGPAGTPVTVVVERAWSLAADTLTLDRKPAPELRARAFLVPDFPTEKGKKLLGVIKVPTLYGATPTPADSGLPAVSADVQAALAAFDAAGVEGIVLDLRGNGGGMVREAVQIAGLFVGNEIIARRNDALGKIAAERAEGIEPAYAKPVVILVDEVTAAGAEMIAGALQDYHRAVVVGPGRTAGIASIATVLEMKKYMPKASARPRAVKMTIGHFYLPRGASPETDGIKPDLLLPARPFGSLAPKASSARPPIAAIAPLKPPQDPGRSERLVTLKKKSEQRLGTRADLRFWQQWSRDTNQPAVTPRGNVAELRQWIQNRSTTKERFEQESTAFRADAPHFKSLPTPGPAAPPGDKADSAADELLLREALRILADDTELSALKPSSG